MTVELNETELNEAVDREGILAANELANTLLEGMDGLTNKELMNALSLILARSLVTTFAENVDKEDMDHTDYFNELVISVFHVLRLKTAVAAQMLFQGEFNELASPE
jgi:hypothetical protein